MSNDDTRPAIKDRDGNRDIRQDNKGRPIRYQRPAPPPPPPPKKTNA